MNRAECAKGLAAGRPAGVGEAVRLLTAEAAWRRQEAAKGGASSSAFDKQADALSYAARVLEKLA